MQAGARYRGEKTGLLHREEELEVQVCVGHGG